MGEALPSEEATVEGECVVCSLCDCERLQGWMEGFLLPGDRIFLFSHIRGMMARSRGFAWGVGWRQAGSAAGESRTCSLGLLGCASGQFSIGCGHWCWRPAGCSVGASAYCSNISSLLSAASWAATTLPLAHLFTQNV